MIVVFTCAVALAACAANSPEPTPVEHRTSASDELVHEQGLLLLRYDAELQRAETLLRRAAILIAAANANANAAKPAAAAEAKAEDTSLAAKARAGAIELEAKANAPR
jgi:hypothetical protein